MRSMNDDRPIMKLLVAGIAAALVIATPLVAWLVLSDNGRSEPTNGGSEVAAGPAPECFRLGDEPAGLGTASDPSSLEDATLCVTVLSDGPESNPIEVRLDDAELAILQQPADGDSDLYCPKSTLIIKVLGHDTNNNLASLEYTQCPESGPMDAVFCDEAPCEAPEPWHPSREANQLVDRLLRDKGIG